MKDDSKTKAANEAKAAEMLRAEGWSVKPPPNPYAPCSYCGKPFDTAFCHMGGCPLGADL